MTRKESEKNESLKNELTRLGASLTNIKRSIPRFAPSSMAKIAMRMTEEGVVCMQSEFNWIA